MAFGLKTALDRAREPVEVMELALLKLLAQSEEGFCLLLVERPGGAGVRFGLGCLGTVPAPVCRRCDLQHCERCL